MKTLITTVLISFLSISVSAESHYLQIKYESDVVSYPPNTPFELFDRDGHLIYNQSNLPDTFSFTERHRLVLHPSYKNEEDIYVLEAATLIKKKSDYDYFHSAKKQDPINSSYFSSSVTKLITKSTEKENQYNLSLLFANGFTFTYTNGKTQAFLDDKELKVVGNYVVDSELGRYKISFRPSNAETWWVFEPKK